MNPTVILVDDDRIINMLHQRMIEKLFRGTQVCAYVNPVEAAVKLEQDLKDSHDPGTILLDINMPEMDAWEILDQLNEPLVKQGYQVIIVSSSVDQEDKSKASLYSSVVDFVEKPLRKEWILQHQQLFTKAAKASPKMH